MASALRAVLVAALLASALLLAAAGAAASELATSELDFEIAWNDLDLIFGGNTTECDVTLLGEFHENTIEKIVGDLIGTIDHAAIANCNVGTGVTVLTADLPWHVRYRGINGTLPGITGIGIGLIGAAIRVDPAGALPACLFRTEAEEPFVGLAVRNTSTGQVTVLNADATASIDLVNDDFACTIGGDLEFNGDGAVTDSDGGPIEFGLEGIDGDPPGELTPTPERVDIVRDEASDTVTLRNTGGATATIDRLEDEAADEFDVSGCGAGRTIVVSGSCVYTVQVDGRPLATGRITVEYDDGFGGTRRVSIDVDILGEDSEADLRGDPSSVTIEALEQNDILEIRNNGGGLAATIDRVTTTTSDREAPDFTVTRTGCGERLAYNEACHYLISVNARPETSGRITVEYDDGTGNVRSTVIEVDIVGPDPAELLSTPGEVSIERLESNDSFVIRNLSPDTAALINRVTLTSDDRERPEFSVTGIGCPETYLAGSSCTYIVSVNSRPEADGRYEIEYDDGAGSDRTVTATIDIAS